MITNKEYRYKAHLFRIVAKANLHVGSGAENYGLIDNLVQRDPATGLPCINASSLKGALKEYFAYYFKGADKNEKFVTEVFGNQKDADERQEKNPKDPKGTTVAGSYRFLQADLLSLPLRSGSSSFGPYNNATSSTLLKRYREQLAMFGLKAENDVALNNAINLVEDHEVAARAQGNALLSDGEVEIPGNLSEEEQAVLEGIKSDVGSYPLLLQSHTMQQLASDYNLPVIARNQLDDGMSKNLWYEQVLPRETRFYFTVLVPDGDENFKDFRELVEANPVQIGANASVGYGFCQLQYIKSTTIAQ